MTEERFLPIGTVVLLKGGKKELMINCYCIFSDGEAYDKHGKIDVNGRTFDYGGCVYPEGMVTSDQIFAFDHDQIDHIVFMGYQTDKQKGLSQFLNESRAKYDAEMKKEEEQKKAEAEEKNEEQPEEETTEE